MLCQRYEHSRSGVQPESTTTGRPRVYYNNWKTQSLLQQLEDSRVYYNNWKTQSLLQLEKVEKFVGREVKKISEVIKGLYCVETREWLE